MKILIPVDTFAPQINGAATFALNLALGMVRRGHRVWVAAPAVSDSEVGLIRERYDNLDLDIYRIPSHRWPGHDWMRFVPPWKARHYMRQILQELRPDVVHYQSVVVLGRASALEVQRLGRKDEHFARVRTIGTNHLMLENIIEHSFLPRLVQPAAAHLWWKDAHKTFSKTQVVAAPTRRGAMFLKQKSRISDVLAISCGINCSNYSIRKLPKDPVLLFVGRITTEKRVDVLIKAFCDVVQRNPHLKHFILRIVGEGEKLGQLRALADAFSAHMENAPRIEFTGRLEEEALREQYSAAYAFCIASVAELQSIATMEAMCSGLPIVAADAMALPHLVKNGQNGYLFQPDNVADCACAMYNVMSLSPKGYAHMQDQSLKLIAPHNINATIDLYERLYRGESAFEVAKQSINEQDLSLDTDMLSFLSD